MNYEVIDQLKSPLFKWWNRIEVIGGRRNGRIKDVKKRSEGDSDCAFVLLFMSNLFHLRKTISQRFDRRNWTLILSIHPLCHPMHEAGDSRGQNVYLFDEIDDKVIAKFRSSSSRQLRIAINPRRRRGWRGRSIVVRWWYQQPPLLSTCALSTQQYIRWPRWAKFSRKVIWFQANANISFCME